MVLFTYILTGWAERSVRMRAITSSHPCLSSFNYSRVVYKKFVRAYSTQSLFTCLDSNSRFESRSSRSEVFCKKFVLKNFAKFTGKKLCQNLFFKNVAGPRSNTSGGCCCQFKQFKVLFQIEKFSTQSSDAMLAGCS